MSLGRYRERITPQPAAYIGRYRQYIGGNVYYQQDFSVNPNSSEPLRTERCWDETHHGPPYQQGGPFVSVKSSVPLYQVKGNGSWRTPSTGANYYEYVGGFTPTSFPWGGYTYSQYNSIGLSAPLTYAWAQANSMGDAAFNSMRPKLEKSGLAVFLGELRDFPDMLLTSARGFKDIYKALGGNMSSEVMQPKEVAEHFLNHQFGWLPFVSDISKIHDTYQNLNHHMFEISKYNGQTVRRRRVISHTENLARIHREYAPWVNPYSSISHMLSVRNIDGFNCRGICDTINETRSITWATGNYKYYRPEFDWNRADYYSPHMERARKLTILGARVSPATLWKLTPWTWLIDWFSNLGQQVQMANDFFVDGVTASDFYIMTHQVEQVTNQSILFMPGSDAIVSWPRLAESKSRTKAASPYGFNLSWDNLSARQLTILAALGVVRL